MNFLVYKLNKRNNFYIYIFIFFFFIFICLFNIARIYFIYDCSNILYIYREILTNKKLLVLLLF